MKTVFEITEALKKESLNCFKSSHYLKVNDIVVRVSNHLPKECNFDEYNSDASKIFLIFAESDLTERQIENHLEKEFSNKYEIEYMIVDESFDFDVDMILNFINRM